MWLQRKFFSACPGVWNYKHKGDEKMTNYEIIKALDIENMALTIMCPYEAGLMAERRCEDEKTNISCRKCAYEWLQEESEV